MDGLRILTDPVLKRWVGPLRRYGPLPDHSVLQGIDAVLISHLHIDHLDPASLRLLPKSAVVIGPPLTGQTVHRVGFRTIVETRRGTALHIGEVQVRAVHAKHTRRRWVLSPATEPLGFVLQGSQTVYYAGDTGVFQGMEDVHEDIDVALLPIETWGVRPPEGRHLSPRSAAQALTLLKPRVAIPIHWGTFYLPGSAYIGKEATYAWFQRTKARPEAFAALAVESEPDVEVRILEPGQSTTVERPSGRRGNAVRPGARKDARGELAASAGESEGTSTS